MQYKYTIPLNPVTKKNNMQIVQNKSSSRPFLIPSRQYKAYADKAVWYLRPAPPKPIDYPVSVKCTFYMAARRRVDKSNLEEAIHDILVEAKVLTDDNRDVVASSDGTRVFYDKANPRTEIIIEPLDEVYEQWSRRE